MRRPVWVSLVLLLQWISLVLGLISRHSGQTTTPCSSLSSLPLISRHSGQTTTPCSSLSSLPVSTTEDKIDTLDYGADMNQEDMMESDLLVIVDHNDNVIELSEEQSVSKKAAHSFSNEQPRGILHRAFSLFCFNEDGKLLLTQRASDKITFPGVWTNTACSHPLMEMPLSEVDVWPDAFPEMPGIKNAAARKAKHELGLNIWPLLSDIQFVSRFHYWASDVQTHGPEAPWGEHEVDYILFLQAPTKKLPLEINPEEVADTIYVSIDELKDMLYNQKHLKWSPWFVGIMERGGKGSSQ